MLQSSHFIRSLFEIAAVAQLSALPWARNAVRAARGKRPPFVLCYHGVGTPAGEDPAGLFVPRELFAEHLDVIAARGYTVVTVSELWRRIRQQTAHGYGAITFDDGLAKTAAEALPELEARRMPCSMYLASGLLGEPHPHLPAEPILSADGVRALPPEIVEVGAHSVDHADLQELPFDQVLAQMTESRRALEGLLGRPVRSMAYPFGRHDERTVQAARLAGYETACGCAGPAAWEALSLPREPIFPSTSAARLRLKVTGLYEPLHRYARLRAGRR